MANVIFKRGFQASLPQNAEDGVFYLTKDTNRLYVGVGNNQTPKLLNQTVNIIGSLSELEETSGSWTSSQQADHVNDFYYLTAENILAVWKRNKTDTGYEWVQINPDTNTTIDSLSFSGSASNNTGTILADLLDSNSHHTTASFAVTGVNGITVSTTGSNTLVLTGNEYSMDRAVTNNNAIIQLHDSTTVVNAVSFQPGDNVTFASTGTNGIVVSAEDTTLDSASLALNNGNINLDLVDSNSHHTTATLSNIGIVLNDGTYVTLGDTTGLTAASTAIYSAAEIDSKFKDLNGMSYKGTLGSGGTVETLPTTGVKNGDTYVVTESGLTSASIGGTVVDVSLPDSGTVVGDMFIAHGTENADGVITSNLQWTYIPSGNDSLASVTYTTSAATASNSIKMTNDNETGIMEIQLVASTGINVVSAVGRANNNGGQESKLISTITHAEYATTATSTTSSSVTSFEAITGLTLDNGHIVGYTTENISPMVYTFGSNVATTANTVASTVVDGTRMATTAVGGVNDLTVKFNLNDENETAISSSSIKMTSSTIKLAKGADGEVVMNMEWGEF